MKADSIASDAALPIGIFDSGIGGLTVVGQMRSALPAEDLVYLGDTARVPYGTKSPGTVVRFACEDTAFLIDQRVKAVVVACNTASAWALPTLEREFGVPVFGVIIPGAHAALKTSARGRIGVIGTNATIRSQAYENAIHQRDQNAQVFTRACPLLVPLVEEGWTHHKVTRQVLDEYLAPLLQERIDTLVLGCTHYPLLKGLIQETVGDRVHLVDSAESCAAYVREELTRRKLLQTRPGPGAIRAFVTDEPERFRQMAGRFLGAPASEACKVELPVYAPKG